jgi:hypothetical protein
MLAPAAWAVDNAGAVEVGFFGLYSVYDLGDDAFVAPEDEGGFGGRLGYHLTENHDLELEFTFTPTEACVYPFGCFDGDVITFGGNYLFNIPVGDSLLPFLKLGVGYLSLDTDAGDDDGGIVQAGVGIRWFPLATSGGAAAGVNLRAETVIVGAFADDDTVNFAAQFGIGYLFGGM